MPPRRSHKKSRAGCCRCKARKIKCDEVHPRCGNCVKHGVACDFEHPEVLDDIQEALATAASDSSPAPSQTAAATPMPFAVGVAAVSSASASKIGPSIVKTSTALFQRASVAAALATSPPLFRRPNTQALSTTTPATSPLLELRLMHHYTALTCKTFTFTAPVTEEVWKTDVPQMAFGGAQHLIDSLLAVAALHMRSLLPNDQELVRASHAYMAASLAKYSAALAKGIDGTSAEPLFLTSTLIAFQSTATRVFLKDDPFSVDIDGKTRLAPPGGYAIPLPWFHSFQGCKAIVAAAWQWLRSSPTVLHIINSQPPLQLDLGREKTFFGHLLEGLEEDLLEMYPDAAASPAGDASPDDKDAASSSPRAPSATADAARARARAQLTSTRQAYVHAVAVLDWAHKLPHKGGALAFPATVSRRLVELLEERRPRAMAVLACFFALLKSLDGVWWLQGMARREVLGILSLFNSDALGPDAYGRWWPHLDWAVRIALWDDKNGPLPPEVWGVDWIAEEATLYAERHSYENHIDMISRMVSPVQSLPVMSGVSPAPMVVDLPSHPFIIDTSSA